MKTVKENTSLFAGSPAELLRQATGTLDATVALCVLDADGKILQATSAFAVALSVPVSELLQRPLSTFLHAQHKHFLTSAKSENPPDPTERRLRFSTSDRPSMWFSAALSRVQENLSCFLLKLTPIDDLIRELEQAQKNETRWRYALQSAHQGVWDHDFRSNELFYSDDWKRIRGMRPDDVVDGSLNAWIQQVHPADREHVLEQIRLQDEGDVDFNVFHYRERHADGHWVWIESRGSRVEWDADGKPVRIIGTDTDITERRKAETELEEVSRRLRLALDVSRIGVFEANLDTGNVVRDDRLLRIYGLDPSAPMDQRHLLEERLHPDDREKALAAIAAGLSANEPFANSFRIVRPDGELRHIRSMSLTFIDADGDRKLIGANWDVTEDIVLRDELAHAKQLAEARNRELEAARSSIEYNALHDHLTKLPNRRFLDQRLDDWDAGAVAYTAILHIDLDRFKQINDTLGHQAGDAMLAHTARVLSSITDAEDFTARVGGDEFVILCKRQRSPNDVLALADRVVAALREPVFYEGIPCRFGASVGIAAKADGKTDAKQLLMDADIALYRAKGLGRNRAQVFTKQFQTQIHHAKRTADEIIKGLEDGCFIPVYQPQFDAQTLDIIGVETLARWRHPRKGVLAPDYFLKIAEDINVVTAIDRAIAVQAIGDFARWEERRLGIPRISVNVSSPRLREPGLIESLKELNIPFGRLSFELLESIFLDDLDEGVAQTLTALKSLGIDIEIDDFGTGHASIIGLMKLTPARLKIDRALIKPITTVLEQRQLVRSIIDIGHSLKIDVIAEGVETLDHAEILRDLGCDALQGYAFAKPMTCEQLELFVTSKSWR
ncbi:sensor domain-containing protein [Pararhizobium gei]|uniref:sensor domain-containing protein n=1 Tax=Pararhizobium gei TaxID=1395951 RepID=UPI0023DCCC52|nr:bifunctional diguanylate cyclase/phosphodiesterase [Rhizobium gei]